MSLFTEMFQFIDSIFPRHSFVPVKFSLLSPVLNEMGTCFLLLMENLLIHSAHPCSQEKKLIKTNIDQLILVFLPQIRPSSKNCYVNRQILWSTSK